MQRTNTILFIFYTLVYYIYSQVRKYEIYGSSNNFPRPVLTFDNNVVATSGTGTGYMVKFNKNAEIVTVLPCYEGFIILSPFSNVSVLEPFCIRLLGFFLNISLFFVFNEIFYEPSYISNDIRKKHQQISFTSSKMIFQNVSMLLLQLQS